MEPRLSPLSSHNLMVSCQGAEAIHCQSVWLRHCLSVARHVMEKAYGDRGGKRFVEGVESFVRRAEGPCGGGGSWEL
jgi:hypothetical protein